MSKRLILGVVGAIGLLIYFLQPVGNIVAEEPDRTANAKSFSTKTNSKSNQSKTDVQKSTDLGMKWLLSAINRNGTVGSDIGEKRDLGCTAMVGVALMAEGNAYHGGPIVKSCERSSMRSLIWSRHSPPATILTVPIQRSAERSVGNADLFIAALFLSQMCGEAGSSREG